MLPPVDVLPDVLPTGRLTATGRPVPELRADLRRIPDARNALTVLGCYAQSFGVIAAAVAVNRWWAWGLAFLLLGRAQALFAILAHEAAHRLLFTAKVLNDGVGRWLLAYPAFVPFDAYRRGHMAHHKDELGPDEPDVLLYANYPTTRASMRRKLTRDALLISGYKNVRLLVRALRRPASRGTALRIVGVQLAIWAVL